MAVGLAAIVVVSVLIGLTKAETERIWLFMGPLAAVAAASILPIRRMPLIVGHARRAGARHPDPPGHDLVSRVLVTGGAGFIGSHLVDALLAAGEEVRILDNLDPLAHPTGRPPEHLDPAAELMVGDLRSDEDVAAALDDVDRVFHLGGIVGNGESMVNVRKAIDSNPGGTATLLEAVIARRDRVRRVVVASSMVVYGEGAYRCPDHGVVMPGVRPTSQLRERRWEPRCPECGRETEPVPLTEDKPLQPISVYGISKRDTEELALVLGEAYGFEAVALRYLNVYGPRQALANPYTGVAAIFSSRLLGGGSPARLRGRPPDPRPRSRLRHRRRDDRRHGCSRSSRQRLQRRHRPPDRDRRARLPG